MKRVIVIGSSGAGKSTFARALAKRSGLPLVHLDAEYWLPGWTEREPDEWQARLAELVAADEWIIDGNYGGSLAARMARADTVIHLDYPTARCLRRAVKRIITTYGRVRADSAAGCPEQFDARFLLYIATFRSRKRERIVRMLGAFAGTVHRFRHSREAEAWLARAADCR